jgi:hypothetical protein
MDALSALIDLLLNFFEATRYSFSHSFGLKLFIELAEW